MLCHHIFQSCTEEPVNLSRRQSPFLGFDIEAPDDLTTRDMSISPPSSPEVDSTVLEGDATGSILRGVLEGTTSPVRRRKEVCYPI
jgi:hypothetical protein